MVATGIFMNADQQLQHDLSYRLRLLDVLDRITRISLASESMDDVMRGVLDLVLEVFHADRAWFLYPCDPDASSWSVPMERFRPEWPGLFALGTNIPTDREAAGIFRELLGANGTIQYGPDTDHPVPLVLEQFSVKSQLMITLRPRIGNAWLFGLHHCASAVKHDEEDIHLFTTIAQRISDSLSSFISIRQLRESETFLREIIDMIPVSLFVKDACSRITLMNWACEEQWGMALPDLRGTDASQFFPPDQMAFFLAKDREVFSNRQLADFEEVAWNAVLKEDRTVHTYKKPVFDEAGNPSYLIGVSIDITERKQAEEVLKLHKLVIDTAMDGFWMVDMAGNLRGANDAYAKMSGYSVDELLKMHISQVEVNESTVQEVAAHIEKIIAQGFDKFETRHRRKDGQEIDVEVSAMFIPASQSFVGFLRDITERKQAERELRELNEHLEERVEQRTRELTQAKQLAESANQAKSEFLANMSHEIRTPMNSILGMANLAMNFKADRRNRDYLKKIHSSGEHLLGIIDDILDFSRLAAGKLKINTADFNLNRVLDNVKNLVAGKAAAKGLKLVFDIDADLNLGLCGDPLRLVQILVNYIDNAVKFTEKGKIIIHIKRIEEDATSCLMRFEVQDNGIGMSEAEKAKLFQPFQQVDTSSTRQYGGAGLGLAICRQLAGMMQDGEVGVESVPGQGSTFWFNVRLYKAGQPFCTENETGTDKQPAAISGARILLAENNLFNQQVATDFLENVGATVCVAQNGKEALDLLAHERFDCVLMDIQMPVLDGFEATRLIRANPALARIPVIAMTANASEEDRERCLAAGMDDFIGKPFKPDAFYAVIAKWLARQPQQTPASGALAVAVAKEAWAGDPEIIDFALLAELVGGDKLKMREFARKFMAAARQDMTEVEAALERKDLAALGALGHHLKSPARMAGAMGFAHLCQALEHSADVEQARSIVSQLRPLLERIKECADQNLA